MNGTALCTSHACGISCHAGYNPCGARCIPTASCCVATDCITPPDACHVTTGATCSSGSCSYPALGCPFAGQTCAGGVCSCPTGQRGCSASGACIPSLSCCTNADCTAYFGQTCTVIRVYQTGGARTCATYNLQISN